MSMLSAQYDRLRERAKELRDLAPDPTVPYLVPSTKETITLAMQSAASEMEDASDAILSLRDRAQALQAENAKLRELVRDMFRDFANADNELKRYQGRTFMAVTRYVPRMRELGVVE